MSNPTVDEALSHALSDIPAVPATADAVTTVVESSQGPATREEAQILVERAKSSATTFAETMKEILDRQAWRPLGYDNPRSFVRAEFKDITAYTGAYVRRMSNVAWMLWAIAEGTNVDVLSVDVPDRLLKQIPGGKHGENHEKLVETIVGRVQDAADGEGEATSERVQEIITDTMQQTVDTGEVPARPQPPAPAPTPQPHNSGDVTGSVGARVDQSNRYGRDEAGEGEDWQDTTPPPSGGATPPPPLPGGAPQSPAPAGPAAGQGGSPEVPAGGAAAAFKNERPEAAGSHAPENQVSFAEVLNATRAAETKVAQAKEVADYEEAMSALSSRLLSHAPEVRSALSEAMGPLETLVAMARDKGDLEGMFDGFDDGELEEAEKRVTIALEQLRDGALVSVLLSAAAGAKGVGSATAERLSKAASEMESLEPVRERFEEMLEELRFLM